MPLEHVPVDDSEARRRIDCAVRRFDASKIAIVMNVVGWRWAKENRPPRVDEIRRTARRLLEHAWQSMHEHKADCWRTSTGGIEAAWERNGDGFDCYLTFTLEDANSEYPD
jgi:hypothetical protein